MKLGKSQREKEVKKVASVAPFNADGLLLFGKRNDNGKWTLPGGHFEPNEEALDAARRELAEETGLKGENLEPLGDDVVGNVHVFAFKAFVTGDPSGSDDPDEECSEWRWVEPDDIPDDIMDNLHSPRNVPLRLLGLQDEEDLQKKEDPYFVEQKPMSGNAIRIAKKGTASRRKQDRETHKLQAAHFAGGDVSRLKPVVVPISPWMGSNMAVNKSRLKLYQRMLAAGDETPNVVVRRNGLGWDLLDGNHRLEAHRAHGSTHINAVEVLPASHVKKSLAGAMAAGVMALSAGGATPSIAAPAPQEQQAVKPWGPEGLHPDMLPIAHLESSFGQNMNHAVNPQGEFHTAYGALGFKPSTAHEEYTKSGFMGKKYPGLEAPEKFLATFKTDPKFYNLLASAHFARLKARHGDAAKAAYAWRHGSTACAQATPEQIKNDIYVQKYSDMALDHRQPLPEHNLAKNDTEDPIDAMLANHDPRERILALKSKRVTAYHLRQALHDEDPDVRIFAAQHPKLTEPMIQEALNHDDLATREAALARPDLTPEHIQSVLFDPDLQVQAARHPRATPDQRQQVAEHAATPEGLRQELLQKNVGYLKYPKLGQAMVPTEPMVRDPVGHARLAFALGGPQAAFSHGFTSYNAKRTETVPGPKRNLAISVKAGPQMNGTIAHETQHGVFSKLKQLYGREAGHRIVATTLSALSPEEHQHLKSVTDWAVKRYEPIKQAEERIAHLQNYLQDPIWRQKAHQALGLDDQQARDLQSKAKSIWLKLRTKAENLQPHEVGVTPRQEIFKAQSDAWIRTKVNGAEYNAYEAQLGMHSQFEAYIKAARFLAGKEPNRTDFRSAMLQGLPLDEAALHSVGLEVDQSNLLAIESALRLIHGTTELKKAEVAAKHTVSALMPDGEETARSVQKGLDGGSQKGLKLDGKHSKGAMMVTSPDGDIFLIKPGSGGQSPAAGAQEEKANQSRREACFWHGTKILGIGHRYPRADLLLVDGKEVAALHMLPFTWKNLEDLKFVDPGMPHKVLEKYRHTGELHKWAIVDFLFGNPDSHGQNVMVGPEGEDFPVALIDHGSAFAGHSFDPANDQNSFVPYYLRAWRAEDWHSLNLEGKLRGMPTCNADNDRQLKEWLEGIHAGDVELLCARYGIDPAPTLARLAKLKGLIPSSNLSLAVNKLWLLT